MKYMGGKSAIAEMIASFIKERHEQRTLLIEPFCGGGAMTTALAPLFKEVRSFDIHHDLILMWQALREGWEPPDTITEAEYKSLNYAKPSAIRGYAGFAQSHSGKWFAGYARSDTDRNYASETKRSLLRDIKSMSNVTFERCDFSKIIVPSGCIVYADPPYSGTTDYKIVFSSLRFWHMARQWVQGEATVYVSEYRAPPDFVAVWERTYHGNMKMKKVTEKLFMHKDQV